MASLKGVVSLFGKELVAVVVVVDEISELGAVGVAGVVVVLVVVVVVEVVDVVVEVDVVLLWYSDDSGVVTMRYMSVGFFLIGFSGLLCWLLFSR